MREFLKELDGEVEARRRAAHPLLGDVCSGLSVERGVDLAGVEPQRVEGQLVEPARARLRIEDPIPRAASSGVVPARRTDSEGHGYNQSEGPPAGRGGASLSMLTVNEIFHS